MVLFGMHLLVIGWLLLRRSGVFATIVGALVLSMGGLAWAMRDISTGTAYAVWVGIGAALTVTWAMITGDTDVSWVKLGLIAGLVGCVVGLKLVDGSH